MQWPAVRTTRGVIRVPEQAEPFMSISAASGYPVALDPPMIGASSLPPSNSSTSSTDGSDTAAQPMNKPASASIPGRNRKNESNVMGSSPWSNRAQHQQARGQLLA